MTRRFESFVSPPNFEVLEPHLLLSGLAPGAIPHGAGVTRVSIHDEVAHPYVGDPQVKLYNSTHTWNVRTSEGGSADDLNETRVEYTLFDGDASAVSGALGDAAPTGAAPAHVAYVAHPRVPIPSGSSRVIAYVAQPPSLSRDVARAPAVVVSVARASSPLAVAAPRPIVASKASLLSHRALPRLLFAPLPGLDILDVLTEKPDA